mmetsp:Transcript_14613/g.36740  ORF Transcript_14613/g.36740 Transcript_14613/m.36740 type:complete len:141 (+) Transcript_14613:383-805(+)
MNESTFWRRQASRGQNRKVYEHGKKNFMNSKSISRNMDIAMYPLSGKTTDRSVGSLATCENITRNTYKLDRAQSAKTKWIGEFVFWKGSTSRGVFFLIDFCPKKMTKRSCHFSFQMFLVREASKRSDTTETTPSMKKSKD